MLEQLQSHKNPLHNYWQAFLNKDITLKQLELISFAFTIQHESLYREKPLPTEPIQHPRASNTDFKRVIKAWHLGCGSMEMENKSNAWWLEESKKFFLDSKNSYDEGMELFEKYAETEMVTVPF